MEPVSMTIGAIAAALVAKAGDRATEVAVEQSEGALKRFVGKLRARFGDDDEEASTVLARVEDAPDSPSRVQALAEVIDARAIEDPGFRADVEALVEEAQGGGVDVGSITQSAVGNQNVQTSGVANSEIRISFGDRPQDR